MKKILAAIALAAITYNASADTMWQNEGRGIVDPSLVAKVEASSLELHLQEVKVNFVLTKISGVPSRLIVMSGGPDRYKDVNFLCSMAAEHGGVEKVIVYNDEKRTRLEKRCN